MDRGGFPRGSSAGDVSGPQFLVCARVRVPIHAYIWRVTSILEDVRQGHTPLVDVYK